MMDRVESLQPMASQAEPSSLEALEIAKQVTPQGQRKLRDSS